MTIMATYINKYISVSVQAFFDDLDKVNLDQVNSEVSLVFIASHGFFDKDLSESSFFIKLNFDSSNDF